jgi:TRAP transporter TAXI family solute receptor
MTELLLDGKVQLIPITDEALANLKKVNSTYTRANIPADTYPHQPAPVPTVGTPPDVIMARADMDADLVYKMTKAVYENISEVQKVSALLKQFGPNLVLPDEQMLIPYHPGARKYFVERGWLK